MTTVTNGVNVQALLDAREVLKGAPEAAQFTWRASAKWQSGVHSQIKVQSFFGLGEEQSHKEEWTFEADHPEVFAAEDNGITPIEYLLVGLASSLTGGIASVAENRGIQLRSVESVVEGGHDIRGILGAEPVPGALLGRCLREARRMGVAAERMAHQDDVVALG